MAMVHSMSLKRIQSEWATNWHLYQHWDFEDVTLLICTITALFYFLVHVSQSYNSVMLGMFLLPGALAIPPLLFFWRRGRIVSYINHDIHCKINPFVNPKCCTGIMKKKPSLKAVNLATEIQVEPCTSKQMYHLIVNCSGCNKQYSVQFCDMQH